MCSVRDVRRAADVNGKAEIAAREEQQRRVVLLRRPRRTPADHPVAEEQQSRVELAEPVRDRRKAGGQQRDRFGVAHRADPGAPGQRGLQLFRRERVGRRGQLERHTRSVRR